MDLHQTNQNLGLEMCNILLMYEKVSGASKHSSLLSGRAYCFQLLLLSVLKLSTSFTLHSPQAALMAEASPSIKHLASAMTPRRPVIPLFHYSLEIKSFSSSCLKTYVEPGN